MSDNKKPPVGLRPWKIAIPSRIAEITAAINRYAEASRAVPDAWLSELAGLNNMVDALSNITCDRAETPPPPERNCDRFPSLEAAALAFCERCKEREECHRCKYFWMSGPDNKVLQCGLQWSYDDAEVKA